LRNREASRNRDASYVWREEIGRRGLIDPVLAPRVERVFLEVVAELVIGEAERGSRCSRLRARVTLSRQDRS
jgi:hypothetical protein